MFDVKNIFWWKSTFHFHLKIEKCFYTGSEQNFFQKLFFNTTELRLKFKIFIVLTIGRSVDFLNILKKFLNTNLNYRVTSILFLMYNF